MPNQHSDHVATVRRCLHELHTWAIRQPLSNGGEEWLGKVDGEALVALDSLVEQLESAQRELRDTQRMAAAIVYASPENHVRVYPLHLRAGVVLERADNLDDTIEFRAVLSNPASEPTPLQRAYGGKVRTVNTDPASDAKARVKAATARLKELGKSYPDVPNQEGERP